MFNKKTKSNSALDSSSKNGASTIIDNSDYKFNEILLSHHSLAQIKEEEDKMKKYLNSNIFNFVKGDEGIDNIFSIDKPITNLIDGLDRNGLNIDRSIPLLKVNNVTKFYSNNKIPALTNVTFRIFPGDFHLITGISGSGKTTLLNAIINETSYEGEIVLNNNFISSELSAWKSNIGVVAANDNWIPTITVQQLFLNTFSLLNMTENDASLYIRSALKLLDVSTIRFKRIENLTKLEKKKIALAIALINDPLLIILDDPLLGLQQHEQIEFLVHLAKLQQKNRSVVVMSHLIDQFTKFANTITILSEGQVFYTGLIENITAHQKDKFSIVTSDNQSAISLLKNVNANYRYNNTTKTIYVKFDGKINALLFQKECANHNILITEFSSLDTSLEDLYSILLKIGTADAIKKIHETKLFKDF